MNFQYSIELPPANFVHLFLFLPFPSMESQVANGFDSIIKHSFSVAEYWQNERG